MKRTEVEFDSFLVFLNFPLCSVCLYPCINFLHNRFNPWCKPCVLLNWRFLTPSESYFCPPLDSAIPEYIVNQFIFFDRIPNRGPGQEFRERLNLDFPLCYLGDRLALGSVAGEQIFEFRQEFLCSLRSLCKSRILPGFAQQRFSRFPGEKPFKCDKCSASFIRYGHLQRHLLIHSDDKPYKCKRCPKSFTQYRNLQTHMYKHTGERPYRCKFCPKGFTQYGTLQAHERTHTGEKPFKCQMCEKAFITSSHLRWHIKTQHGQE